MITDTLLSHQDACAIHVWVGDGVDVKVIVLEDMSDRAVLYYVNIATGTSWIMAVSYVTAPAAVSLCLALVALAQELCGRAAKD